jgi:hypothetical protein
VTFYRTRDSTGRVGLDLPRVLRDARTRDNFVLQDGDSVLVPAYNPVVRVVGAVNAPSAVAFAPGQNIDDYVRAAGGPGPTADLSRAYVRQPNGKVQSVRRRRFLPDHVPTVRAGATVEVPAGGVAANSLQQTLNFVQAIITLVGGLATTYVLVRNLR